MGSLPPEMEDEDQDMYASLGLIRSKNGFSEAPRVLSVLSALLERSIQKNEKLLEATDSRESATIFHGLRAPHLNIRRYVERIFKYAKCSTSCFVLAHIYINKFLQQTGICLNSLNVHRLLITGVVVAAKFSDDAFFNNAYYAKVGGVSTKEMNRLELNFLFSLDFRIHVTVERFGRICFEMEKEFMAGGYQIERPIQMCGLKGQAGKEEAATQPVPLAMYTCGAT